jgi:hypothetical protein
MLIQYVLLEIVDMSIKVSQNNIKYAQIKNQNKKILKAKNNK